MNNKQLQQISTILISRTDSIGDVILTFPLCVWLKTKFPDIKLIFLGKSYTKPVTSCLSQVDEILCWDEISKLEFKEQVSFFKQKNISLCIHVFPQKEIAKCIKKAKIPNRIGTSHRLFHWFTCNIRPNFTRKDSDFHEAQLNFELLRPLGLNQLPKINEICSWLTDSFKSKDQDLPDDLLNIKNAIILHPKSQGSAIEWPLEKYITLANELLSRGQIVCFSGTENEGDQFRKFIPKNVNCYDLTGKLNLSQFIFFISKQKALVACSTGPYHIAGVLGIKAIGLFSSRRPIHPGRWKAIGKNAVSLELDPLCKKCTNKINCSCILNIDVLNVLKEVKN